MRNFFQNLRRSQKVVALFVLMVLLPAAIFTLLIVRAARSERARLEYEKAQRQRQVVRLTEADLTNWLFSAAPGSARSQALLTFEVQGDQIVFPEFELSLSLQNSPLQRPFDSGPPLRPLTRQSITDQYFPRIEAFRRDLAAGRNRGAQYFPRLAGLVVQPPGSSVGYVVDVDAVLEYVNDSLAEFAATEPFTARVWIGADRTARPPADSVGLEQFSFFEISFEDAQAPITGVRAGAFFYSMAFLLLVTGLGSVFVYRAVSQEARLARLRSDFVAAVSHEFRSPLSSILALAERLERIDDAEKLREYHRIIGHDARRLSALVTRLLDFALIEEGKKVYTFERIDLVAAAREAIESMPHAARPERIRLLGAERAPLWVRADRTALHHAIQNLVDNATKYSPPDAPVVVQCTSANGSHMVDVCDRGMGIPASEQPKIFEKFYRGRHVSGLNVPGVGIGLALVRHLVESHDGSIAVESEPGQGSRFSLRLPKMEA